MRQLSVTGPIPMLFDMIRSALLLSCIAYAHTAVADSQQGADLPLVLPVELALPDLPASIERFQGSTLAAVWYGAVGDELLEDYALAPWFPALAHLRSLRVGLAIPAEGHPQPSAHLWFDEAQAAETLWALAEARSARPIGGNLMVLLGDELFLSLRRFDRELLAGPQAEGLGPDQATDWDIRCSVDAAAGIPALFAWTDRVRKDTADYDAESAARVAGMFRALGAALGQVHLLARVADPLIEERWLLGTDPTTIGLGWVDRAVLDDLPAETEFVLAVGLKTEAAVTTINDAIAFFPKKSGEPGAGSLKDLTESLLEDLPPGVDADVERLLRELEGTLVISSVRVDDGLGSVFLVPRQRDLDRFVLETLEPDVRALIEAGDVGPFGDEQDKWFRRTESHWVMSGHKHLVEEHRPGSGSFRRSPLARRLAGLPPNCHGIALMGAKGQDIVLGLWGGVAASVLGFRSAMTLVVLRDKLVDEERVDRLVLQPSADGGLRIDADGLCGSNLPLFVSFLGLGVGAGLLKNLLEDPMPQEAAEEAPEEAPDD